jgi:hypothetical protein
MSDYSIYHCEGVGCGVADGVTETRLPTIAPETGGTATPSIRGLLEQDQAPTASTTAAENIASQEIRLRVISRFRPQLGAGSHATGA